MGVNLKLLSRALHDVANALDDGLESASASGAPQKVERRAKKLVPPPGHADELAARRAVQILREHGVREIDVGGEE